ncbi:MAG TPA: hypothetical protein VHV09_14145 [Trebonia sp.]|jgi:hypothetical protein|nr:hypothetical protein [Trebonia sp.]
MSQPGDEATAELPEDVERPEDDDHDLLTFGEAGARLEIELRTMRARLAELESASPRDEAAIAQTAARLAALKEGAERNSAQPINDENFELFFGYPGKARRNTTW